MLGEEGGQVGVGAAGSIGPLGAESCEFYSSLEGLRVCSLPKGQVLSPALNPPPGTELVVVLSLCTE